MKYVSYSHPFKITIWQLSNAPSFWHVQAVPPKPMKVWTEVTFMDDFGSLVRLDYLKLAIVQE